MGRHRRRRYRLLRLLGEGGMSRVWLGESVDAPGRPLAIKEVREAFPSREEREAAQHQFRRETRILTRLRHPGLPRVLDAFVTSRGAYLVMTFVPGRTVEALVRTHGPVSERRALSWGVQLCRTLHYLSLRKPPVVFRDLKPANIIVTPSGRAVLIDFGIAREFRPGRLADTFLFGTPGFAAPEQYGRGQTDLRSDLYALGATLHACLTGRDPSRSPFYFPELRSVSPRISRETSVAVMRALEPDPARRYGSAVAMRRALQRALAATAGDGLAVTRPLVGPAGERLLTLTATRSARAVEYRVPLASLGCATYRGRITFDVSWLTAEPDRFDEETALVTLRLDTGALPPDRAPMARMRIQSTGGSLTVGTTVRLRGRRGLAAAAALALLVAVTL
ncbi:MAG TPA: serine/threonine-protein kinase [Candidatus Methylomirabilis sp.]|nr:serine/threonine-protein kinase [Candidatus Methylomirabilis sp.]